ncbi:hypothetical protein RBH29_03850 [Herbivorax sp. ANBcel31]|uniref:hypothetical protein n=1 Tax=Herbivorax sp. ANBcel31 TaxID=3069754 RepID=UPI0027AEFA20|nr:hypothetical protein [Herbivorax sp. ANBcel31]MDQ2085566.1 hypothetical protein [Herbivorax sp. ANBcel31]
MQRRIMEHIIFCVIVWSIVFILIPFFRIKELAVVILVSIVWMIFVDNISTSLGYYSYHNLIIPVGTTSLFHLLALSGVGILMINWLKENSFTKLLAVFTVGLAFSILQGIYIGTGAFSYEKFDVVLSFIHSIAALSIFVWLSLSIVGEEKIYSGHKSRIRAIA